MKKVFLLIDDDKNVVAIYEAIEVAKAIKSEVEKKVKSNLRIEERTLNPDIYVIGVKGMS